MPQLLPTTVATIVHIYFYHTISLVLLLALPPVTTNIVYICPHLIISVTQLQPLPITVATTDSIYFYVTISLILLQPVTTYILFYLWLTKTLLIMLQPLTKPSPSFPTFIITTTTKIIDKSHLYCQHQYHNLTFLFPFPGSSYCSLPEKKNKEI